jgi:hypothetical protein
VLYIRHKMDLRENRIEGKFLSWPGVATTRLAEGSGAARHLQKMLLQINKIYNYSDTQYDSVKITSIDF